LVREKKKVIEKKMRRGGKNRAAPGKKFISFTERREKSELAL